MKKEWLIFSILFPVIIIIIAIALIIASPQQSPPTPSNLEECQTLSHSSDSAINLVFFSPENQAKKYSSHLLSTSPFSPENFNIYYISDYSPDCELYQDIATFCHSPDLIKKAASCPNDYIIVLDEQPNQIRSSAYLNVLSINTRHPLSVFTHEFGHAFANLAEEYVPATLPRDSPNCVQNCDQFTIKDGCFQGCSKSSYQRSIEAGVMRTLSSNNYGKFNEQLISQRFQSNNPSITGSAISPNINCQDQSYYLIEAQLQGNKVLVLQKSIEQGCPGTNGFGSSDYIVFDSSGNPLIESNFNPDLIFTDAPAEIQIDGTVFPNTEPFTITLPIIKAHSLEIKISDETTQINLIDIGARPCKL